MDAVYVLQELLEGITYQEFCWELPTCKSLEDYFVALHRLIFEIHGL